MMPQTGITGSLMLGGAYGVCLYRRGGTGALLNCMSSGLMTLVHSESRVPLLCPALGCSVRPGQQHRAVTAGSKFLPGLPEDGVSGTAEGCPGIGHRP